MSTMSRFRNPVEKCGWCLHPMEVHNFEHADGTTAVPCAHCQDNTCDVSKMDLNGGDDGTVTLQLP